VSNKSRLTIELASDNPPRKWLSPENVQTLNNNYFCSNVLRKGKQLCMVLEDDNDKEKYYLYLHMGMTGRIVSPNQSCRLENYKADDSSTFPPKYTYLILRTADHTTAFSDPRKFGSCQSSRDLVAFEELAPDALDTSPMSPIVQERILPGLACQRLGVKALLLDQKRIVSGVGNWVADEVLYQCEIHPDQAQLTMTQANDIFARLQSILAKAVECQEQDYDYPDTWLFRYRWTKKKQGNDAQGRSLTFLTSGGRTSAIVASIQKLRKAQGTGSKKSGESPRRIEPAIKRPAKKIKRSSNPPTTPESASNNTIGTPRRSPRLSQDEQN
jgi:formamidopyrimidine-DNA glycosylase